MVRLRSSVRRYQQTFGTVRGIGVYVLRILRLRRGALLRTRVGELSTVPWVRLGTSDELSYYQVFVKGDYDLDYVEDPRWIVDAGANVGFASLYFAERFPRAQIIAIEPDPANFAVLRANTAAYPQITRWEAALWDASGAVTLVDPGIGSWGFQVDAGHPDVTAAAGSADRTGREVRAVTVADILAHTGSTIDILKVDIEGGEREVFAGCRPWIDAVDSVVIELHERFAPGADAAFEEATRAFTVRQRRGESTCVARPERSRSPSGVAPGGVR